MAPHTITKVVGALLLFLWSGCSAIPPDPYLGTVNANTWDALYGGNNFGSSNGVCLAPRSGYQGQTSPGGPAGTKVLWYYLGNFSASQLDITNATDPNKTPPQEAYQIQSCIKDQTTFDPEFDNYQTDLQYPIFATNVAEPTSRTSYKPWYYLTQVSLNGTTIDCNDVRNEQTLWSYGGWDPLLMTYGSGASSAPLTVMQPTAAAIQAGMVSFKDWPLFNYAEPIQRSESAASSCPFASRPLGPACTSNGDCNGGACLPNHTCSVKLPIYPTSPTDTKSDYFFPRQSWLRGLLNGYLDGGDVPLNTTAADCLNLFSTGQSCMIDTDCKVGACYGAAAGATGACVATAAQLDTGVSCRNTKGAADATLCATGQTCSAASLRCLQSASLTSTGTDCSAAPCGAGQVCATGSGGKKTCSVAPWPVCPKVNDVYVPMGEASALGTGSVSVTVGSGTQTADQLVVFSNIRGDGAFSPVCRVRYYDPAKVDPTCTTQEMEQGVSTGRPLCTTAQLVPAVQYQNELSFVNCVFSWQQ